MRVKINRKKELNPDYHYQKLIKGNLGTAC
jgi:hypothetical protein